MERHAHLPWLMGHLEWLELGFFVLLTIAVLVLLLQYRRGKRVSGATAFSRPSAQWRSIPEIQFLMLSLPLELLWEIAQFPLYTVWHEGDPGYILYGLAHCTLGDLLILLAAYWIVAVVRNDRSWYLHSALRSGALFTMLGAAYTVYSEITNVRVKGTWDYTVLMPIIPGVEIGAMPFLQWILIPPVLIWLVRLLDFSSRRS